MNPEREFDKRIAAIHGLDNPVRDGISIGEGTMDIRHEEFRAMADVFLGDDFDKTRLRRVEDLQIALYQQQAELYERYESAHLAPEEYVESFNALLDKTLASCESILGSENFVKLFGAPRSELAGFIEKEAFVQAHQSRRDWTRINQDRNQDSNKELLNDRARIRPVQLSSSLNDPLSWIEKLTSLELLLWLRRVFWTRNTDPVTIPDTALIAGHLIDLLSKASAQLMALLRGLVPDLLREWGPNDSSECLHDILLVCSAIRSIAAEPTIVLVMSERLKERKDATFLRQRCLMTLSEFGCTDRTAHVFRRYINDPHYVAICFPALCKFNLSYAATQLEAIVELYRQSDDLEGLRAILKWLFLETLGPSERVEVWRLFLSSADPEKLVTILHTLKSIGIVLIPNYHGDNVSEEIIVQYEDVDRGTTWIRDTIRSDNLNYPIVSAISYSLERSMSDERWLTADVKI